MIHIHFNTGQHAAIAVGYVINLLAAGKQPPYFYTSFPDIKCVKRFSGKLSEAQQMYFCEEREACKPYCKIRAILIILDTCIFLFNWLSKHKENKTGKHFN